MTRNKAPRARLGMTWFALALGALALLAMPGLAAAKDRNHDHIPDKWEKRHHLSLKVNQARLDQDRDHLRNRAEFLAGDNPRDDDSNDDGVVDGEENAGTIASFDTETGKLVINCSAAKPSAAWSTKGPRSSARTTPTLRPAARAPAPAKSSGATTTGVRKRPATTTAARVRKSPVTTTAAKRPATTRARAAKTPVPARGTTATKAAPAPPLTSSRAQSSRRRS